MGARRLRCASGMTQGLSAITDAIHRADGERHDWLQAVVTELARGLDVDGGVFGVRLRVDRDGIGERLRHELGIDEGVRAALEGALALPMPVSVRSAFAHAGVAGRMRRTLRAAGKDAAPYLALLDAHGIVDIAYVFADSEARGTILFGFPIGKALRARTMSTLVYLGGHLATAFRIDDARARLRETAVHGASDVADANAIWRGIVAGRWTMIDRFDRDGRRYILARRNDAETAPWSRLSPREEEIVRLAARAYSSKCIAYELGVGISTVTTHLSNAMAKLGVTSRAELAHRYSPALRRSA